MEDNKEELNKKDVEVKEENIENNEEKKEIVEEKQEENKKEETKFKKAEEKRKELDKKMQEMIDKRKKNKKRCIILGSIIGVLLVIALFVSTIFAFVNINNDKIVSGVSISGIDMSGLSKDEAKAKLEEIYNKKEEQEIKLKRGEYETVLSPVLMEVDYKIDEAVEEAYKIGKEENIFVNNYKILFALIWKEDIQVNMTLNEEVTRQTIDDMNTNLSDVVIESSYTLEDEELIITKGKPGVKIDTDNLLNKAKEILSDTNISDDFVEIPVINKDPDPIDIDKIHEEVYKEAKDAYYTENPLQVYPEEKGIDFDVENAREILKEDKEEYVIPLIITEPKVTLDDLGTKAFPDQLATFTTRYDVSDVDRTTNLVLAIKKINGTVLRSGEEFSYNKVVGARTVAAGYKNAKIYSAGQVVDGLGGGICQVSSTLYNAALLANLEITERRNHQFVTSYVEAGRDATVVYGSTDFKFKNTRKYPIRIVATAKNGILTMTIYGIKEENEYTFKFTPKVLATTPYQTQYIDDNTLPEGTEKVKQKGAVGKKVQTTITKFLNGKVVSSEVLSVDTYTPMTRIILRGTKKVSSQTSTPTVETPTDTTETTPEPEAPSEETTPTEEVEVPDTSEE